MTLSDQLSASIALEDDGVRCMHCGAPATCWMSYVVPGCGERDIDLCAEDEAILRDKIEAFVSVMEG